MSPPQPYLGSFFCIVIVFFHLVFTPLGDSLAASGRQALHLSTDADPKQWHRLMTLVELGKHHQLIEACPTDVVDHMPCEDPRRNSQLSQEMSFYRERHCRLSKETPICLIPTPNGYKIPIPWLDNLTKKAHTLSLKQSKKFQSFNWVFALFVLRVVFRAGLQEI
ncbi:hypothetical protein ACFX1X_014841 [Malus domestica]